VDAQLGRLHQRVEAQLGRLQRRRLLRWRGSFKICARHVAELHLGGRELALGGRVALVRRRRRQEPRDELRHCLRFGERRDVAATAVGVQVVLVLATSSRVWKSLNGLLAALLCNSRGAEAMLVAGRPARHGDARDVRDGTTHES